MLSLLARGRLSVLAALALLVPLATFAPGGSALGAALEGAAEPCAAPEDGTTSACLGIRPGADLSAPHGCTMAFVLRDAEGQLYVATAGHCVDFVGQRVAGDASVGEFGTVVFFVNAGVGADFALVAIDAAKRDAVSPSMCRWGGPTAAEPEVVEAGMAVKQYGQGFAFNNLETTRPREGALSAWREAAWWARLTVTPGDSGSPLLAATGEALGVVTHVRPGFVSADEKSLVATSAGTRLTNALALAETSTGIRFELLTAPLALDA